LDRHASLAMTAFNSIGKRSSVANKKPGSPSGEPGSF
jgi:hypothetical protein